MEGKLFFARSFGLENSVLEGLGTEITVEAVSLYRKCKYLAVSAMIVQAAFFFRQRFGGSFAEAKRLKPILRFGRKDKHPL